MNTIVSTGLCAAAWALIGCSGHVDLGHEQAVGVTEGSTGGSGQMPGGSDGTGGAGPTMGVLGSKGAPETVCTIADAPSTSPPVSCACSVQGHGPCPVGDEVFSSALITPDGGTVELSDTASTSIAGVNVQLKFPRGAVTEPTLITIAETSCPVAPGLAPWSPVYQFLPVDLALAKPVDIVLPIAGNGSGYGDHSMGVYFDAGAGLARLPSSYLNAGFMNAAIEHLGSAVVAYSFNDSVCH